MLTADRNTKSRLGRSFGFPVAADKRIFAGSVVGLNATGFAIPADDTAIVVLGVSDRHIDNTDGADGDLMVEVNRGIYALKHSGMTNADIGKAVAVTDDETVILIVGNETPALVQAGVLMSVDEDGAWVKF